MPPGSLTPSTSDQTASSNGTWGKGVNSPCLNKKLVRGDQGSSPYLPASTTYPALSPRLERSPPGPRAMVAHRTRQFRTILEVSPQPACRRVHVFTGHPPPDVDRDGPRPPETDFPAVREGRKRVVPSVPHPVLGDDPVDISCYANGQAVVAHGDPWS